MEGWVDLGYPAMHRPGVELAIFRSLVRRPNHYTTEPPRLQHAMWWKFQIPDGIFCGKTRQRDKTTNFKAKDNDLMSKPRTWHQSPRRSTGKYQFKPVGDWISTPSPNFIAMATRVGPQHFSWFHWIGHPRKPPSMPKHLRSICHTSQLVGDFVQILESKFWALGGLNQKSKKTVL